MKKKIIAFFIMVECCSVVLYAETENSCNTGYVLNPGVPDFMSIIGANGAGVAYGAINNNGDYVYGGSGIEANALGISSNNSFGAYYGSDKGTITGRAICSSQQGYTNATFDVLSDETGQIDALYCYCILQTYTQGTEYIDSLSASWVYMGGYEDSSVCASHCARECAAGMRNGSINSLSFRTAMFNTIEPVAPYCERETYNCAVGYYLPADAIACEQCLANNICVGGTYSFNETVAQGIQSCASGTFAPTGSTICYPHILHVGNDNIYLRSAKLTTPSLNIRIGNDIFYANMTTVRTRMNKDTIHYFHVQWGNNDYYVCDDTTCPGE